METEKKKLTDNQLRLVQAIAGVLAAAALMVTIMISPSLEGLLQYLFVGVFLVITFGRRWFENKYRLRLNFFNLVMIVGIMIGIFIFVVLMFYPADGEVKVALGETEKMLILIGVLLVILVLGFGLPIWLHFKRKAKGTLVPIRIPEKTEEEEKEEAKKSSTGGGSSIARQIAEMQRELEEKDREDK